MRPSDLRVGYVYTGRGGKQRLVIDKSGGVITYVADDGHRHDQGSHGFAEWAKEGEPRTAPGVPIAGGKVLNNCPLCHSNRVYINTDHQAVICFKCGFSGPTFVESTWRRPRKLREDQMVAWWNGLTSTGSPARRIRWKMGRGGYASLFNGKYGEYSVRVSSANPGQWAVWRGDFASSTETLVKNDFATLDEALNHAAILLLQDK